MLFRSARGVRESEKKKERKSECGGREKRSPLPLIYWRPEGIVGAGSPAHDVRNGRGVSAHDLPRGFRRRLPGRTICRIRGHRNPRARCGATDLARPEASRAGVVKAALECLRWHSDRRDRRDTCGKRASVTSIHARKSKRRAEMLCHVKEAMTRRNQKFARMSE